MSKNVAIIKFWLVDNVGKKIRTKLQAGDVVRIDHEDKTIAFYRGMQKIYVGSLSGGFDDKIGLSIGSQPGEEGGLMTLISAFTGLSISKGRHVKNIVVFGLADSSGSSEPECDTQRA